MANYELWYADSAGNRLEFVSDCRAFRYAKVLGDVGALSINLPYRQKLYNEAFPDRRIHIYRQAYGGGLVLELIAFLRRFGVSTDKAGQYRYTSDGYDLNEMLARRIVAYYAGGSTAQASSEAADNAMKDIFTENFLTNEDYSGVNDARDLTNSGYSVEQDASDGPTISKGYAWRIALNVLQDMQAMSKAAGTEVFFGIVPVTETTAQFMTWVENRDRTITGNDPVVFSLEWGNLLSPSLDYDYSTEANAIYAGGQGQESSRVIATDTDAARGSGIPVSRREAFAFSSGKTLATVTAEAEAELERRRPRLTVSGTLLSTPQTPYGGQGGWELGDKVTVNYAGLQFDVVIRSVYVSVGMNGKETVMSRIENV